MASEAYESIAAGLKEAVAHRKGELTQGVKAHSVEVDDVDIKALRGKLLRVIEREPEAVLRALAG